EVLSERPLHSSTGHRACSCTRGAFYWRSARRDRQARQEIGLNEIAAPCRAACPINHKAVDCKAEASPRCRKFRDFRLAQEIRIRTTRGTDNVRPVPVAFDADDPIGGGGLPVCPDGAAT